MKSFNASTPIEASADTIWQILTDGAAYPEWDPYCERIEGKIEADAKLKAYTKLSPGRAFPVRVTVFNPRQKMVWTGGMPLGLFKGERRFELKPAGDGQIMFTVSEIFTGPMLLLIGNTLPDMTEPFRRFAEGLKQRAESLPGS